MNEFRKVHPALTVVGLALAVSLAQAAPVSFGVTAATITLGAGYGVDVKNGQNDESGGTLLDVVFQPVAPFAPVNFSLDGVGSFQSFLLGTVAFNEPNTGNGANEGVSANEADGLGVEASLTMGLSTTTLLALNGAGKATRGTIIDADIDYQLKWTPLVVDFGNGGKFGITLNTLSFSGNGQQDLIATVELLVAASAATDGPSPAAPVPEPATLALVAVALAGAGAARRWRKA